MMPIKFVDYEIEHKGFWDYGYKYWLTEQFVDTKGRPQSKILLTTNDFGEVIEKVKELASQSIDIQFEENESFKQHISSFNF